MLIMIALLGGSANLFADEVTFIFGEYVGEGAVTNGYPHKMVKEHVSISDTKFFGNSNYVSFYAGGTTTITPADRITITKITINVTEAKYNGFENEGSYTASVGQVSKPAEKVVEWTGSASTSFTIEHTKIIRWTSIVVTFEQQSIVNPDVPEHTASFSINGSIDEGNDCIVVEGNTVTFPLTPSIHGYTFKGWSKAEIAGTQVTAPELIDSNQERMGTCDVTYYAVFASNDYTELEPLDGNSILKDGDRIAAFINKDSNHYGLYHAEAEQDGFIENYMLATSPAFSDIIADPKRSWMITSAGNSTWYMGDTSFGYLYNEGGSDNFSLSHDPRTSFSIEWNTDCFHIRNGVNYRWLSCYVESSDANRFKFQGAGTGMRANKGNYQFQIYRLTSTFCTTIPSSPITFAATDGQDYYATFCNYDAVAFPKTLAGGAKLSVEVVNVEDGVISMKDVATDFSCVKDDKVIVPANTGVLLRVAGATVAPTVSYSIFTEQVPGQTSELKSANMLIPCLATGKCPAVGGSNRYYRLAYGDFSAKKDLGFWWGAEEGTNDFNVKAGGAVLCVPKSIGSSNIRGFGFNDTGTLTIVDCRADRNNTNAIYNLMGQRVSNTMKGIAIDKGRKVLR